MSATSAAAAAILIRGADLAASPWRNGGGVTREIAVFPPGAGMDEFIWRASVAEVARPGPFSRFAGVDRILVLLAGAGLMLDEAGAAVRILARPLDSARFAGESAIEARLIDGATQDFNLMLRRDSTRASMDTWRGGGRRILDADVVLLFCAAGAPDITLGDAAPVTLLSGDTLRIEAPRALCCTLGNHGGAGGKDDAAVLAFSIRYT